MRGYQGNRIQKQGKQNLPRSGESPVNMDRAASGREAGMGSWGCSNGDRETRKWWEHGRSMQEAAAEGRWNRMMWQQSMRRAGNILVRCNGVDISGDVSLLRLLAARGNRSPSSLSNRCMYQNNRNLLAQYWSSKRQFPAWLKYFTDWCTGLEVIRTGPET